MITEIGGEMSEELKRCPFCGEMPETDGRFVQCYLMPCDARHFIMPVKSWQKRPIEDALNARIAKLVNLVEVQHDDNCHLADMCRQRDASIAELEATIDQLIAAGESLTRVAEWRYANLTELLAWDTLVEKIHKEREK